MIEKKKICIELKDINKHGINTTTNCIVFPPIPVSRIVRACDKCHHTYLHNKFKKNRDTEG